MNLRRRTMRVGWVLLLPILVLACGEADRFSLEGIAEEGVPIVRAEEPEAFVEAAVDLTLGVESGGGPFEFSRVSGENGRYNAYRLKESSAEFVTTIRSATGPVVTHALAFHPDGGVIDIGGFPDGRAGCYRIIRDHLDVDGSSLRREEIPCAPQDRAPTLHGSDANLAVQI